MCAERRVGSTEAVAMRTDSGFSLLELILVLFLLGMLSAVAYPGLLGWMANYRLGAAASDLRANMQLARLTAIRTGSPCKIDFKQSPDHYRIDCLNKAAYLADYGSGVTFERPPDQPGNAVPTTEITFTSRGTCSTGSAYLTHEKRSRYYRVWTWSTGVIRKRVVGGHS